MPKYILFYFGQLKNTKLELKLALKENVFHSFAYLSVSTFTTFELQMVSMWGFESMQA